MKYLLILLISALFFALTYASAPTEFPYIDLFFIISLIGFFVAVESLVVWAVVRWRTIQNLVVACFITFNVLSLNLVLNETFLGLSVYLQLAILLAAMLIFYLFAHVVDTNRGNAKGLIWLYLIAIAGVLVQARLAVPPPPEIVAMEGKTSAENLRLVAFKETPNVYFISFDSLLPSAIMEKHLGISSTAYHAVLDEKFRRFKNFFADYPNTLLSLNSLLALDTVYFDSAVEKKTELYFFPGLIPSPLLEIFKANGYETTTSYQSLHMGHKKGPYVDNYRVNRWDLRKGACRFVHARGFKAISLAGYCYLLNENILQWALMKAEGTHEQDEGEFLMQFLREGARREAPQVFVSYIFSPGHTWFGFEHTDDAKLRKFQQHYLDASEETADYLSQIIAFIETEDPEAIVYIFGDHGPHMARTLTLEENPEFVVQDALGVFGGMYPADRCKESYDNPYNEQFMTVSQGALLLIRCLTGGVEAFSSPRAYRLPSEFITNGKERYEDYLYE